mgnify:CR=1 FL=1
MINELSTSLSNFILIPFSLIISIIVFNSTENRVWIKTIKSVFIFILIFSFIFHLNKGIGFIIGYSIGSSLIQGSIGYFICSLFKKKKN